MRAGDGIVAELFGLAVSEWGWSVRRALDCPIGALILACRESRRINQPREKRGFGWAEMDAMDALCAERHEKKTASDARTPTSKRAQEAANHTQARLSHGGRMFRQSLSGLSGAKNRHSARTMKPNNAANARNATSASAP